MSGREPTAYHWSEAVDDIVRQAMAKWPNVPACFGWLGLDARGQWWMRDERCQALGAFQSGGAARGSRLQHDKLIDFIGRNYACETDGPLAGCWYFQNGPQRVYVELALAPWIWRLSGPPEAVRVHSHTGLAAKLLQCSLDDQDRLWLNTDIGAGVVHTLDMTLAASALELGHWQLAQAPAPNSGFVLSPQALRAAR